MHHSSEELEWISAARFHPVNLFLGSVTADVVMLLLGISPNVFVVLGPFTIATSAFVHANLDWTLGPFKYVIAGPVFHRWHHTAADRGGEKNFAATFPILDVLFGTFYMPAGELPDNYGIGEREYPTSFPGQLVRPFIHAVTGAQAGGANAAHIAIIVKQASPAAARACALPDGRFALHSRICSQVDRSVDGLCNCRNPRSVSERIDDGVMRARPGRPQRAALAGLLAVLLALAAPGCGHRFRRSRLAASPTNRSPFSIDQATILKLPERAATVVIGDPLIADLSIQPGGLAVVTGKGYGATNVVVMDHSGAVLMEKIIEVKGPDEPVVVVYRGVTRQTYSCTPDCSPRVTLGDTGKDDFDKDSGLPIDYFDKTLSQTVTRSNQAMAAAPAPGARREK